MTGFLLFGVMALLLAIGVPISVTLGASVLATIFLSYDFTVSSGIIAQRIFGGLESTSIMAIAFFILAGNLMTKGGISRSLVELADSIVGSVRGGMSMALVLACAFFAALSGSAPATVVAIGVMLYEDMVRLGYPKERVAGLLVVSGGLGPIIPPSIVMVLYSTMTGASISELFKSGMTVGIVIMLLLLVMTFYYARKEHWPKNDEPLRIGELLHSLVQAVPALMLPVIILGGIYSGIMTPTESSAVAVVWSLFVGLFIYKNIRVADLGQIILDSGKNAAMILFIIATSTAFSWIFAYSGISGELVSAITAMDLDRTLFCMIVAVIFLIFGTFMEGIAIAVLLVPIFWPIADSLGVDVVHFGLILTTANVIGCMTPPVAVNIFSAISVTKLKMGEIIRGQLPFFLAFCLVFLAVVLLPGVSTFMVR
ncbi:MAG: TRAP transporter large permease [Lachnospiraceae bacterium]|nr:TRAP transporter large permease [Lachnospiraceae bacterium]